MIDLAQKKDPFITQSEEKDFYDKTHGLNLNQQNFRIAIGASNFSWEERSDPKYVKWIARLSTYDADKEYETVLPIHKCTQEDFD